ncbi:uncharacterized protein CDV56_102855 [Aspergillus thermomutatus]|uniref:Uncharacterized protein n=1 Tax=Aspergillus thermomutatus TaxID=41047 RepID=A0A397HMZ7_ASPTH|nr:uncharacterized protein CDV56_102855 [Aspergillus thermomutatus]RHZ64422.1 hypothetical protein CDV56_102855 [Aspergillus thermomutatus]
MGACLSKIVAPYGNSRKIPDFLPVGWEGAYLHRPGSEIPQLQFLALRIVVEPLQEASARATPDRLEIYGLDKKSEEAGETHLCRSNLSCGGPLALSDTSKGSLEHGYDWMNNRNVDHPCKDSLKVQTPMKSPSLITSRNRKPGKKMMRNTTLSTSQTLQCQGQRHDERVQVLAASIHASVVYKHQDEEEPVLPSDSENETHASRTKEEIFLTETGFPMPTGAKRRPYHTWVLERHGNWIRKSDLPKTA